MRIVNRQINQTPKAIGRTARVLAAGLPYSVETFHITPIESGLPTTTVDGRPHRDSSAQVDRPNAGEESWETTRMRRAPVRCWPPARSGGATSIRSSTGR